MELGIGGRPMAFLSMKSFELQKAASMDGMSDEDKVYSYLYYTSPLPNSVVKAKSKKNTKMKDLRILQQHLGTIVGLINKEIRMHKPGWGRVPRSSLKSSSTIQDCLDLGLKK